MSITLAQTAVSDADTHAKLDTILEVFYALYNEVLSPMNDAQQTIFQKVSDVRTLLVLLITLLAFIFGFYLAGFVVPSFNRAFKPGNGPRW